MSISFIYLPAFSIPSSENTVKLYKAKNALAAAKKAYRDNKTLSDIAIIKRGDNNVQVFSTQFFFSLKKEFKYQR